MQLQRYRAVLFDLDGTLVDSNDALTESINHARRSVQLSDLSRARIQTLDVAVIRTGSLSASDLQATRPDVFLDRFSDLLDLVRDGAPATR